MSYEKIAKVVDSLIVNTELGKIKWKESSLERVGFEYSTQSTTVTITCEEDYNSGQSIVVLKIYNDEGRLVESVNDYELSEFIRQPYISMKNLFETARRQSLGVESILDDLLEQLPDVPEMDSLIEQKKRI